MHDLLAAGLHKLGLEFVVPTNERLAQLNTVYIPQGADDANVRSRLLNEYNLEIGAGLGQFAGKAWRIGLMGFGVVLLKIHRQEVRKIWLLLLLLNLHLEL